MRSSNKRSLEAALIQAHRRRGLPNPSEIFDQVKDKKRTQEIQVSLETVLTEARSALQNKYVFYLSGVGRGYDVTINDDSVNNPFVISGELVTIVNEITKDESSDVDKARIIL